MEDTSREQRARRRRLARALHPDLGGDADAFIDAMAAPPCDDASGSAGFAPRAAAPRPAPPNVHFTGTFRRSAAASLRRAVDTGRGRLPRGWPGSRRYIRL